MTGLEAIYYVHTLREDQVRAILNRASERPCATLRRVCEWSLKDADGWSALLTDLNLAELPRKRTMNDAIQMWRERHWTDNELVSATGLSLATLRLIRRTTLRDETWSTRMVGRGQKAYRLLSDEVHL